MKTDRSIRNICVAKIKRTTIKPFDFELSRFFETESIVELNNDAFNLLSMDDTELPISQVVVDSNNWTLITTRQIISCLNGVINATQPAKIKEWHWNEFKGYKNVSITLGRLLLSDGQSLEVYIETGNASMVTIYAIMTLTALVKKG